MRKPYSILAAIVLTACVKDVQTTTLEHSGSYAAIAIEDTITLPDGRRAVLNEVCYTDTVIINSSELAPATTVFTGSSTVKLWPNLESTFGIPIIRRAWSGYGIMDIFYRVDTAVTAKHPDQIVVYCGDNDFDRSDLTDQMIYDRYKKLIDKITLQNPDALSLFVSVKPNPSKPQLTSRIIAFNSKIESYLAGRTNQLFVNTFPLMYSNGQINMSMYEVGGSVHLRTPQGYDGWKDEIKNSMIKR